MGKNRVLEEILWEPLGNADFEKLFSVFVPNINFFEIFFDESQNLHKFATQNFFDAKSPRNTTHMEK